MAYAALSDMIERYGEIELVRLTTPENEIGQGVVGSRVAQVLDDASGLIDSHLRRHYQVPVMVMAGGSLPELVNATCILARYALHTGPRVAPNEQVRTQRAEVMAWLRAIETGSATLDGAVAPSANRSFARFAGRTRDQAYRLGGGR